MNEYVWWAYGLAVMEGLLLAYYIIKSDRLERKLRNL
jgi:hypothetical protein